MHLWILKMYHALFNGFEERLNADCLTPTFKLDQQDGEFRLEPLLFIRGDVITLSLLLVSDPICISQTPGRGLCLSIGYVDLKLRSLVGGQVSDPISLVFGGRFH